MTYKTTTAVRDTQDNGFYYHAGATYPRQGLEVSKERLETLVKNGYIVKEELTSKEIKAKLDELAVKYKSSASKAELLDCLKELEGNNHD